MREKTLRLIITFRTTAAAMAMEKHCLSTGVPGRLSPVPREISSGCGMSWSAPPQERDAVLCAARDAGIDIEGAYEIVI